MTKPADLYHDATLASFYDLENGWKSDFDFCTHAAKIADTILDLGCGTGELASHLGQTKSVTAVDPARAMLDIGKTRQGGDCVNWIEGDATEFTTDARFDLIILTSHSFQVFLTEHAQLAVLKTIATHLAPNGRFVFDSRNPTVKAWQNWMRDKSRRILIHPDFGETIATTQASYDDQSGIVTYETFYQTQVKEFHATSKIKFTSQPDLSALMTRAGLEVLEWFGDWEPAPFHANSKEIIPFGCAARGI